MIPADIIARAILDAGRCMGALAHHSAATFEGKITDFILRALADAGYRILGADELDGYTLEKAAEAAEGQSHSFDFASALAELRDCEHGFHSGRLHASSAIRLLQEHPNAR